MIRYNKLRQNAKKRKVNILKEVTNNLRGKKNTTMNKTQQNTAKHNKQNNMYPCSVKFRSLYINSKYIS